MRAKNNRRAIASTVGTLLDRFFLTVDRPVAWLDGLRCVAVGLVFLFHFSTGPYSVLMSNAHFSPNVLLTSVADFGWSGVELFFVISGFLVGGSVLAAVMAGRFSPLSFFTRRIVRTLPPALVLLAITVRLWQPDVRLNEVLFQNIFFVTNYTNTGILGISWSLCVEEHFYLLLCLAAAIIGDRLHGVDSERIIAVLILSTIVIILMKLAIDEGSGVYVQTHWQLDFFFTGMALRLAFERDVAPRPGSVIDSVVRLFACLALFVCFGRMCAFVPGSSRLLGGAVANGFMSPAVVLALALAVCWIYAAGFSSAQLRALFGLRPLRWIAGMSYSIYLVHTLSLNYPIFGGYRSIDLLDFIKAGSSGFFLKLLLAEVGLCLFASLVFFAAVERPMLILRKWFVASPKERILAQSGTSK